MAVRTIITASPRASVARPARTIIRGTSALPPPKTTGQLWPRTPTG